MKVKELEEILVDWAPASLAEGYDNIGLLVGNPTQEVSGVLVSLDLTEDIIDEAAALGFNVVLTHHPIWFTPLKKLTGKNYVERIIIKAIKNDIALIAIHTNADNITAGVNQQICTKMGLQDVSILKPKDGLLTKIEILVPIENKNEVQTAMFKAGAGSIGNYSDCSFVSEGVGSFTPGSGSNPTIGQNGKREFVKETKIEMIFPNHLQAKVVKAIKDTHPYEEVAFQLIQIKNQSTGIGSGMIGKLPSPMEKLDFLSMIKDKFNCGTIRYSDCEKQNIQKVAVCGGSGSFLIQDAMRSGVDAFVTADITYHKFFDNENQFLLMDIGHYESEQFTNQLFLDLLSKKIPNFDVRISERSTNPVKYFG